MDAPVWRLQTSDMLSHILHADLVGMIALMLRGMSSFTFVRGRRQGLLQILITGPAPSSSCSSPEPRAAQLQRLPHMIPIPKPLVALPQL